MSTQALARLLFVHLYRSKTRLDKALSQMAANATYYSSPKRSERGRRKYSYKSGGSGRRTRATLVIRLWLLGDGEARLCLDGRAPMYSTVRVQGCQRKLKQLRLKMLSHGGIVLSISSHFLGTNVSTFVDTPVLVPHTPTVVYCIVAFVLRELGPAFLLTSPPKP
jgi:hypothetical protein